MTPVPDPGRPRTGLVLGKFLPPHRGHQLLLDFARSYVDRLTVLVCSLGREPIPGALRHQWVAELAPGARVLHVTDENPSEPADHPDFWSIWIATIRRRLPEGPDVVFTSEGYGAELAARLGARHVMVDAGRQLVPVSGTAIRARPLAHWDYLPACVRPYFVKRVVVFGPESTGKTTLCRDLARHFGTVWVSEYGRTYLDAKQGPCTAEDIPVIARGHAACEEALARQASRLLFLDTDLLITRMYSELYFGGCPEWVRAEAARRRYDLYLFTDIDVPWVADPQREFPGRRAEIRDRCLALLKEQDRPYVVLHGPWQDRFARACAAVAELLRE